VIAEFTQLAAGHAGEPFVAYATNTAGLKVRLAKYDGDGGWPLLAGTAVRDAAIHCTCHVT
jgi:hypothetical protein